MGALEGKVAAITGAGGGIGRAHALLFAREGAKVVVNDVGGTRDGTGAGSSMADEVVSAITAAGGEAIASYDDVAEPESAERIVQTAIDRFGKLDILINNAGILRDKTLVKMTEDMWDTVQRVHLRGTFLCTRAACRHMRERGEGGRIINTTSVSGMMGNFGQANYAAAKAGIYGFTRTVAMEMHKYKVTVNALAPVAYTRMTEDLAVFKGMPQAAEQLSPELIAPAAAFLASDAAAHITGYVLAVEGKQLALFKVIKTQSVSPRDDKAGWSPAEIAQRWEEIAGAAPE